MTSRNCVRALTLAILAACCAAPAPLHARPPDRMTAAKRSEAPACSLSPEQLAARREELLPGFLDRAESVTEIRHGVRLSFARRPGLVTELAALIEQEHDCCSFLSFRLITSGDEGPVTLEVRGPRGTSELIRKLQQS